MAVHVSITTIPSGSATAVRRRRRVRASPAAAAAPSQALLLRLRRIPGGKDRWRTKYASLDSAREDIYGAYARRAGCTAMPPPLASRSEALCMGSHCSGGGRQKIFFTMQLQVILHSEQTQHTPL